MNRGLQFAEYLNILHNYILQTSDLSLWQPLILTANIQKKWLANWKKLDLAITSMLKILGTKLAVYHSEDWFIVFEKYPVPCTYYLELYNCVRIVEFRDILFIDFR